MDNVRNIIAGGAITLLIGGAAYTFTQEDVVKNFAQEAGVTQEEAEQYVANIPEDELVSFTEVGEGYITGAEETESLITEIDCVNYTYEWESATLTCAGARAQLQQVADTERALGQACIKLDAADAADADIRAAITLLETVNQRYDLEAAKVLFDPVVIEELKKTNLFNKSLLRAALESRS